jgi:SAM-dependent methyltransferase
VSRKSRKPWKGISRALRHKIVRGHLDSFLRAHSTQERVLDLGCGSTRYSVYFPNRIGLDFQRRKGVDIVADAHNLPFERSSFSAVLTTEMLEHVKDPQRVVDEIQRILRPGGKVILTTRFVFPIHDAPFDFYRFTKYGLAHLLRNWVNVEIQCDTTPFEGIGVLFQRMAYQSDFHGSKLVTAGCLLTAQLVRLLDKLVKKQYGDYDRNVIESEIITSGYHVVAYRP